MKLEKINLYDNLTQKEMGKLVGGANEATRSTGAGSGTLGGISRTWSSDFEDGYMSLKMGADPTKESSWTFVRISITYCFDDEGGGSNSRCPDGNSYDDATDGGSGV